MHPNPAAAFLSCALGHLERMTSDLHRASVRRLAEILGEDHRHIGRAAKAGGPRDAVLRRWLRTWKDQGFPEIRLEVRAEGWVATITPEAEVWAEVLGAQRRSLRSSLVRGCPIWEIERDEEHEVLAVEHRLVEAARDLESTPPRSVENLRSDPWIRLRRAAGLAIGEVAEMVGAASSVLEAIEAGDQVPDHDLCESMLELYALDEGQRATLHTTHITWDVRYRRGTYVYWSTDNATGNRWPVTDDWKKRQLQLSLSLENVSEIEARLEKLGLRYPSSTSTEE